MIKADNVTFEYGEDKTVLNNVNMHIKAGEFVSILGHNGSGKSTLAKHFNALNIPKEGTVWVDGMDTTDETFTLSIRQTTGMVFQNPDNQIVASIIEEDVAFGPENMGIKTDEIWRRVETSLATVNMLKRRYDSPDKLSGGQRQRVAIASVLAMRPKCIVLDEPTAMLDPIGRKEVIAAITKLNKEAGISIVLITHNMEETVNSDRIFVMHKGEIVMEGTPKEIFAESEKVSQYFLEIPEVTLIADELIKAGMKLPKGILDMDELADAICRELEVKPC